MIPALARARLLVGLALFALLAGLWAALTRIGWEWPSFDTLVAAHGPLMIAGFFGTLVNLERAVALDRPWAYAPSALSALGALATLTGFFPAGPALITLGSLAAVGVHLWMLRRHTAMHTGAMVCAVIAWAGGNLVWLSGAAIFHAAIWWMAFLVLTIAGERLELGRVLRPSRRRRALFVAGPLVLLAGLGVTLADFDAGIRLAGVGLLALALWLFTNDVARRTVRGSGLTRYIAICLLLGYGWLAIGGVLAIGFGGVLAGLLYDAELHAVLLGFVFSMIFAHMPIILPAVMHLSVPYRSTYYLHVGLLHASLALRIAGDLLVSVPARQWGGLLNVVAILLFLGATGRQVYLANFRRPTTTAQ
ncbi:MAG: hypothetical protein HZB53_11260 [Chloroflexi bacterium]|nr:hypothetical protein [Chloroflexota bacterium]